MTVGYIAAYDTTWCMLLKWLLADIIAHSVS
jgi:hypothetical protein